MNQHLNKEKKAQKACTTRELACFSSWYQEIWVLQKALLDINIHDAKYSMITEPIGFKNSWSSWARISFHVIKKVNAIPASQVHSCVPPKPLAILPLSSLFPIHQNTWPNPNHKPNHKTNHNPNPRRHISTYINMYYDKSEKMIRRTARTNTFSLEGAPRRL